MGSKDQDAGRSSEIDRNTHLPLRRRAGLANLIPVFDIRTRYAAIIAYLQQRVLLITCIKFSQLKPWTCVHSTSLLGSVSMLS